MRADFFFTLNLSLKCSYLLLNSSCDFSLAPLGLPPLKSVLVKLAKPSGGGSMDDLDGISREIETLDRYAERLRRQIEAAQRELARVTRKKQQLLAEVSKLKKARKVMAV